MLSTALATVGAPLGLAAGGFLVEGIGLYATTAGMAAAPAAVGLWAWLDPALEKIGSPPEGRQGTGTETPPQEPAL